MKEMEREHSDAGSCFYIVGGSFSEREGLLCSAGGSCVGLFFVVGGSFSELEGLLCSAGGSCEGLFFVVGGSFSAGGF